MDNFKPGDVAEVVNVYRKEHTALIGKGVTVTSTPYIVYDILAQNRPLLVVKCLGPGCSEPEGGLHLVTNLKKIDPPEFDLAKENERDLEVVR